MCTRFGLRRVGKRAVAEHSGDRGLPGEVHRPRAKRLTGRIIEGSSRPGEAKRTAEGFPVHRFRTLLQELGTVVKNRAIPHGVGPAAAFDLLTQPTPLHAKAFDLLGLRLTPK